MTDFELLLIDDGSPDKSGEICDEYAAKDKRVRVIYQENKGSINNMALVSCEAEKFSSFFDMICYKIKL